MPAYVCLTCGVQQAPSDAPPPACPVCEDERQFIGWNGQQWASTDDLRGRHETALEELEPGLDETAFFDPLNFNFPYATYVCEVEVDPETGTTDVVKFTAVDDVGNIINPMIVDGQVHGGVATGIGQAIMENAVYDGTGQLVSGSLMDYTMPRADDVPMIDTENTVTPCPLNPLGVKGVGEIGAIGAPPAVINAVVNALGDYGVDHIDMPATPQKIWQAIQSASAA